MTEDQIRHMVNRFLGWRLPEPWQPDNGISYQRPNYAHAPAEHDWPTGTNLFDASQAEAMVRYMLEGMPATTAAQDELIRYWPAFCDADQVPDGFIERMEQAGLATLRKVTRADLEAAFAVERGIEKGGMIWVLTLDGEQTMRVARPHG